MAIRLINVFCLSYKYYMYITILAVQLYLDLIISNKKLPNVLIFVYLIWFNKNRKYFINESKTYDNDALLR